LSFNILTDLDFVVSNGHTPGFRFIARGRDGIEAATPVRSRARNG